jgi:hypothetical protein
VACTSTTINDPAPVLLASVFPFLAEQQPEGHHRINTIVITPSLGSKFRPTNRLLVS